MRTTPRAAAGLVAITLATTLTGAVRPAPAAAAPVPNPSFEDGWRDGRPACWDLTGRGRGRLTLTRDTHSNLGAYVTGAGPGGTRVKLTTDRDPACRIPVSAGSRNRLAFWARSTTAVRPFVDAWSARTGWRRWFTGRTVAAGPLRRTAVPLPPVPAGVTAVSVGFAFEATGMVVLDDVTVGPPAGHLLFGTRFPATNGIITNDYAYWSPSDPRHVESPIWLMTSGSLFSRNGIGYSGIPDDRPTDALSRSSTRSAIFRLTTRDESFGDVSVQTRINVRRLWSTPSTPRVDWDGVHLFLRYKSQYQLYYTSVARRDGKVVIKKKCPGGRANNGTYYPLTAETTGHPIRYGLWTKVGATVQDNADGSVTIVLLVNGRPASRATDTGVGCRPLTGSGAVGIRGDNAEFEFTDFGVRALA